MEKRLYTKDDLKKICLEMGIKEGMTVLLQINLSFFDGLNGKDQILIDVLKEIVTESGCLIVPTFCYENLDPSCLPKNSIQYDLWELYREELYGFDEKLSSCSIQSTFANQFLRNTNVKRSNHPVYSFAYWGSFDKKWLRPNIHFPISFNSHLESFMRDGCINLLMGVRKEKSVLLPAVAQVMNEGKIVVSRGKMHNLKKNQFKDFMTIRLNENEIEELLMICNKKERIFQNQSIVSLSLDSSAAN